jgi:hypothetical protein
MRVAGLLFTAGALAATLFGQEFQGTVWAASPDTSGAVVPDVQVKVVNIGTGAVSNTRTNMRGTIASFLLPAEYRVLVEHPGFLKIEHVNVRVSIGAETTLDAVLEVSTGAETVTVRSRPPR